MKIKYLGTYETKMIVDGKKIIFEPEEIKELTKEHAEKALSNPNFKKVSEKKTTNGRKK